MKIVETSQIPLRSNIIDVPIDDMIEVFKTCQELQILCELQNGIGISAVQAGIPWKLFLIKGDGSCPLVAKNNFGYFINCQYYPLNQEQVISLEGCLSIKDESGKLRSFEVNRFKDIRITGYQIQITKKIEVLPIDVNINLHQQGVVFQHEIDHHKGILISDIGKEVFVW